MTTSRVIHQLVFLVVFLLLSVIMTFRAEANLLVNPSFEAGYNGWDRSGIIVSTGCGVVTNCWWVHTGDRSVDMTPMGLQNNSSVRQTLSGLAAGEYEFGVYTRITSVDPVANWDQIQVSVFGNAIDEVVGIDPNAARDRIGADGVFATTDWILLSGTFTAGSGATALLNINFQNFSDALTGVIIDDAFVRSVPEPTGLVLMFLGLTGIGLVRFDRAVARV